MSATMTLAAVAPDYLIDLTIDQTPTRLGRHSEAPGPADRIVKSYALSVSATPENVIVR